MAQGTLANRVWPDVTTIGGASAAKMYGVWAAVYSSMVTALFASWSLGSGKAFAGFVDAWAFVDVAIFAAVAFGIYKESRFAAVGGLGLFLAEKISQIVETGEFQGAWMATILVFCYVASIRGTFALAKLRTQSNAG